jgi:hypothetical protein
VVDLGTFKTNQRDSQLRQAETKEFFNTIGSNLTFAAPRSKVCIAGQSVTSLRRRKWLLSSVIWQLKHR